MQQIFEPFENPVTGKKLAAAPFFRERDFVEQILHQPEGTEKSADKSAENRTEEQEKAHGIEREPISAIRQGGLQCTQWAGTQGTGAGVAIESGDAHDLSRAGIDISGDISLCVRII